MRAERLDLDAETASETYYACLLFYAGCTADAEIQADLFRDENALLTYFTPAMFGSQREAIVGIMRALAPPGGPARVRAAEVVRRLPKGVRGHRRHLAAICEVARMLTDRLGLPVSLQLLWAHLTERWDGKGEPGHLTGDEIPLPLRIVHVARDATFQHLLGGEAFAVRITGERAGAAFDPKIAAALAADPAEMAATSAPPTVRSRSAVAFTRRTASASNWRSIRVLALAGVSSVVEYTILSAACQISAKSCTTAGCSARSGGRSQKTIVSYIRRPHR